MLNYKICIEQEEFQKTYLKLCMIEKFGEIQEVGHSHIYVEIETK